MTDQISIPDRLELDIRRPNGAVETVIHPTWKAIDAKGFDLVKAATAKAGRGEVLAYRNIRKLVDAPQPSAADLARAEYERHNRAVYVASAGGEYCDALHADRRDNTPAHRCDD